MEHLVRLPKKNNTLIIYNKVKELIEKYFNKLNIIHQNILIRYLYRIVLAAYFYFYDDNFINQIYLNNYQDIFSFLVLLLPYFELNNSNDIKSLDELFLNSNSKSKSLSSSYYIDHQEFISDPDYLNKYFKTNVVFILNTFNNIHCSLMPNWINIFPYTMETYKESLIYKNFKHLYENKYFYPSYDVIFSVDSLDENYIQISVENTNYFKLGYPKLYGVIYNFLYMDIKPIKWMIYDINIENKKIIPNIIYLAEKLELKQIVNKPWAKLNDEEKNKNIKLWEKFYKSEINNKLSLKTLVLFYLRWEKENDNLLELKFPSGCFKIIKTNLDEIMDVNKEDIDEDIIHINDETKLERCLNIIYPNIKYDRIYNFIYDSIQRFKYTWYGFVCMDESKNLLNEEDFFINYFNKNSKIKKYAVINREKYFYITPKNIYNFYKSLIHIYKDDGTYILMSTASNWDNVSENNKGIFVSRLNTNKLDKWFNINKNIARTYQFNINKDKKKINNIMDRLRFFFYFTHTFVDIIFQTLIYNGMLSYFKYNPELTDNTIIPDKNKYFPKWKEYILSKIKIEPYAKSYHPFSNTILEKQIYKNVNTIDTIKNSMWYMGFGANWIAQIQLFHHYINNRVLYITGATGAGKSTIAPFLLVYGVKMINYKNDAKVVCTQPRTQPVKDNSVRMSENIGYPIIIKKDYSLDKDDIAYRNTSKGEGVLQDINYIQYKHKKGTLVDELYHPCLCLYTDGSLYNIINHSYLFKKQIKSFNSESNFTSTNLFDIILVDEAHEHGPNMDLILTLSKFATYVNNQITLGIISATMDDDEIIYRKYYEPIDDNWKFPFNLKLTNFNKNYIDRRIHLSIPFGGMNFEVKEYPSATFKYPKDIGTFTDMRKINTSVIEILKYILSSSQNVKNSDILIFQPGESDIKKLLKEINEKTPPNVLAIPFYSKLDNDILENIVKKIDKPEVRIKLRYPKNKYDITQINDIPLDELLPEGTYTRFIILATNIAEASITIDTFEYVIDVGNQKINIYDYDTNQSKLETLPISVPNQKQRKGRVGRVKPGTVFYTYDRFRLSEKVGYKLNTENISSFIFDMVSSTNKRLIDADSDPYKTINFDNIPDYLSKQYVILIDNDYYLFNKYYKSNTKNKKKEKQKIIYPYSDGKYDLETLMDETGEFFIIHPNEDYFERNPLTLEIKNKNKKPNYFNKVERVFKYGKLTGMIGINNLLTPYGKLVNNMTDFMEFSENSIDYTKIILDSYTFGLDKNFEILKNIIMFIVFKNSGLTLKTANYSVGKSDYLLMMKQIDSSLFELFKLDDVFDNISKDFNNYDDIIKDKVNTLLFERNFNSNTNIITANIEEIKKALISFYQIKLKLDIINKNTKYFLKKDFDIIFIFLLEQKKIKKLSNEYLLIINKIILYYIDSDKFMSKNIIFRFLNELIKIPDTNESKNTSTKLINKIKKFINSVSLFDNENLIEISLNLNSKFILKSKFDSIFSFLLKQKKISNPVEYLGIINKIILYYIDSDKYINYDVIQETLDELKKIPDTSESKNKSNELVDIIQKLIGSLEFYEYDNDNENKNENLIRVKLKYFNKIYPQKIIDKFNKLNDYDKLCFVIIKNITQSILIKVPFTEFYINYYNRDINNIYSLETIFDKYTSTKVPSDIRNFYIFEINMNDYYELNNILVLSENVINLLDEYLNILGINLFKININLDKIKIQNIYPDKYVNIIKKIDKITEYILK
jgi:hypothetical protein